MAVKKQTKYLFITGGVLSGLGKGITAASIAKVLKSRGLTVNLQKCDPYLNTDAGTLNPAEHGEVFVTRDGAETDLDLGHYERFLDQELTGQSSLMSGNVLAKVIGDERKGEYLGKTIQIIPHVTNAIMDEIQAAGEGYDVHIVEIGGTVGDYEGLAFLEAARSLRYRVGRANVRYVHVVYLPYLEASKEIKTKPAQNAVRSLRENGINPDVLIARSDYEAPTKTIEKLSLYTGVEAAGIMLLPTVDSVYKVQLLIEEAGTGAYIANKLGAAKRKPNLTSWKKLVATITNKKLPVVTIGVVAKYMDHEDTYMSVFESIKSAAWHNKVQANIVWIDAEKLGRGGSTKVFDNVDGILVPCGFGTRGLEGKSRAANYAMKNHKPYLGLCLGLQMAVVALARQVVDHKSSSTELDPKTPEPVISLMEEQTEISDMGGTMRLGNYTCQLQPGTLARKLYGASQVEERHRHRYELDRKS